MTRRYGIDTSASPHADLEVLPPDRQTAAWSNIRQL